MSDYGVKPRGLLLKRLDTIIEELHTDLTLAAAKASLSKDAADYIAMAYGDANAFLQVKIEGIIKELKPVTMHAVQFDPAEQTISVN